MLATRHKLLRRFWYATVAVDSLQAGPRAFTLLGERIVLFLDAEGEPAALEDRCCHRTARLSKGAARNGHIACGYHGWEYDRDGVLVTVPQLTEGQELPRVRARAFSAVARYGYVWVALDEPSMDIPDIPEDGDASYRRIPQFDERWETSALRLMENSFDAAHIAFVHQATFGDIKRPTPDIPDIIETDYGFEAVRVARVANPPHAARITGTTEPFTERHGRNKWFLPFCRRLDIGYPSGLRHIIFNCATPIDDSSIQVIQILYRNDKEEDCSAAELIAWDAAVIAEDREMLESTEPNVDLDVTRRVEMHMPSDRPGLVMRRRLLSLLESG